MQQFTLLSEVLINTAEQFPEKIALVLKNQRYSYRQLLLMACAMAKELKLHGLERGDRVVIKAENTLLTVVSIWATLLADGIFSTIAADLSDDKIHYVLADSGAKFYVSEHIEQSLVPILRDCKSLFMFFTARSFDFPMMSNCAQPLIVPKTRNHEIDLAAILYTSGSTGEPKGVMLTHRNMLAACFSINHYLCHSAHDVILSALPMSFDYGLYQMIMSFSVGATFILERDALWPAQLLKKIQDFKVTVLPCVPTLFNLLAEHGARFKFDYGSLRAVTNTGAALTKAHIKRIQDTFPNVQIFSMYGLTECKRCSYLPPEMIEAKPDSVGVAIPNTELWVVDENDCRLGPNQIGQLVIRGATVMKGYWNNPLKPTKNCGTVSCRAKRYCIRETWLYLIRMAISISKAGWMTWLNLKVLRSAQ